MSYQLRDSLGAAIAELATKPAGFSPAEVVALNTQVNELCAAANDAQFHFDARISNDQVGALALHVRIQETSFNQGIGWGGIDKYAVYVSILLLPSTDVAFCGLAAGKYGSSSENDIAARAASIRARITPPPGPDILQWTSLLNGPGNVGGQLVTAAHARTNATVSTNYQSGAARGQLNKAHTRSLAAFIVGDVYSLTADHQNPFPSDEQFWATVKAWYVAMAASGFTTAKQVQDLGNEQSAEAAPEQRIIPDLDLTAVDTAPPDDLTGMDEPWQQAVRALLLGKHVIFYGPPGCGKTTLAIALCQALGRPFDATTASPEWGSFDTVGGYTVQPGGGFLFQAGIVLRSIMSNTWLLIDEINRANIDRALGPLFSMLTGPAQTNAMVTLPYKDVEDNAVTVGFGEDCTYRISPDWRILGTMNTMDKASLFRLSYAFSRRFAFIDVPPPQEQRLRALLRTAVGAQVYSLAGQEIHLYLMRLAAALQEEAELEIGAAILIDILKAVTAHLTNGQSIVVPGTSQAAVSSTGTSPVDGVEEVAGNGEPAPADPTEAEIRKALLSVFKMYLYPQFEGNRAAHTVLIDTLKASGFTLSSEEERQLNKDLRLWTGVEAN